MADAARELPLLAARLKAAGELGIRRSMIRQLRAAAKPVAADIQESARQSLPKRGGMNEYIAARKPTVSVRTTGRSAGVSIKYSGPGRYSNESGWRHPVFGHKDRPWTTTTAPAAEGWWERGGEKGTPEAVAAMEVVLEEVAVEVNGLGI